MSHDTEYPVADDDIEQLRVFLHRSGVARKEACAYIQHRVQNIPLWYIADDLAITESTVKTYVLNTQSVVTDIRETADVLSDIEETGISLTDTPGTTETSEQTQTNTVLLKYNSTYLSHGEVSEGSYPSINRTVPDEKIIKLGRGRSDRFPFALQYFLTSQTQRAAQLYASITANTFAAHEFATEYRQLAEQLAEQILSSSTEDIRDVRELHDMISQRIKRGLTESDGDDTRTATLPETVDCGAIPSSMGETIPDIYSDLTHYWTRPVIPDTQFTVVSHNLFHTSPDRRPFRTAAIFATSIGWCLENPLEGPYQFVVQHGSWVLDMPELICHAVCEPAIKKIVLVNDFEDSSPPETRTRFDTGIAAIHNHHPNRIPVTDKTTCSQGERKYIEITDDEITHSCWNKSSLR